MSLTGGECRLLLRVVGRLPLPGGWGDHGRQASDKLQINCRGILGVHMRASFSMTTMPSKANAIFENGDEDGYAYVGRQEALRSRKIITNPAPTMNTTPGKIRCTGHSLNTIQPIASADGTPKYSNGARSEAGVRR